jgi:hypothetical protein
MGFRAFFWSESIFFRGFNGYFEGVPRRLLYYFRNLPPLKNVGLALVQAIFLQDLPDFRPKIDVCLQIVT